MFFVHPQIKLNKDNLKCVAASIFRATDRGTLKKKLSLLFPKKQLVFTDMGRSAFKIIIEQLNLENSQIIFPAFICDIFYPILKRYNIKPVFLDIDLDTFNIDPQKVLDKVGSKTKAVLVSHTFGLPADIDSLLKKRKLIVIEDGAHALRAKYKGKFVGNYGRAAFFSLYKQFPTFRGGLLVCPKDWEVKLGETRFGFRDFISFLNSFSLFAFLFKKFTPQKIAETMTRKEKEVEPAGLNSLSLSFFSNFFSKHQRSIGNRTNLALFFQHELKKLGFLVQESKDNVFCYLSALIPKGLARKRDKLVGFLQKEGIFCTRIWHTPIILNKEVQKTYKINLADFPNTVEAATRIINFPLQNYYTKEDVEKIINSLKKLLLRL